MPARGARFEFFIPASSVQDYAKVNAHSFITSEERRPYPVIVGLPACLGMEFLEDPRVRIVLETLRDRVPQSFLVGGMIRDALMGRPRGVDLDIALAGDGFGIARDLAELIGPGASFVPLDSRHGTGRLVIGKGEGATIDISALKGPTITEDLRRRDFTVNAMAVTVRDFLTDGLSRIIDPTGGRADLQARVVKACSPEAFVEDPLRILRAFRFQACLTFSISRETLGMIPASLPRILGVAWERIRDEFMTVLASDGAWASLKDMDRYGLPDLLFPELLPMKGAAQNFYHHLDVWHHALETVRQMERLMESLNDSFGDHASQVEAYLRDEPVRGRPLKALLKLAALFHDVGKPHCATRELQGRIRFFGHEPISEAMFEKAGKRLKLSGREIATIRGWIKGHMRTMILTGHTVSNRALLRLHRAFEADTVGLLLLFLADLGASQGPARPPEAFEHALRQVRKAMTFFAQSEEKSPAPLVNGHDVMAVFGVQPGPFLGSILKELAELQAAGEVTTRDQALAVAAVYVGKRRIVRDLVE